MKIYLKDFCVFLHVAETGSLSKTSEIMGLSISSVSKRLSKLEEYLQINLFERNTRGVKLSPLGARAYAKTKEMTEAFSIYVDDVRGSKISRLNIYINERDTLIPLPDWISSYSGNESQPDFNIYSESVRNAGDALELDDILITKERSSWPLAIHRKMYPVERKIVVNVNSHAKQSLKGLRDMNVVFFSNDKDEVFFLKSKKNGEEHIIKANIHTDSIEVALQLVKTNGTIVFGLPEYIVSNLEKEGGILREVMGEWLVQPFLYYVIWKERKYYKKDFKNFIDYIENRFSLFLSNGNQK